MDPHKQVISAHAHVLHGHRHETNSLQSFVSIGSLSDPPLRKQQDFLCNCHLPFEAHGASELYALSALRPSAQNMSLRSTILFIRLANHTLPPDECSGRDVTRRHGRPAGCWSAVELSSRKPYSSKEGLARIGNPGPPSTNICEWLSKSRSQIRETSCGSRPTLWLISPSAEPRGSSLHGPLLSSLDFTSLHFTLLDPAGGEKLLC